MTRAISLYDEQNANQFHLACDDIWMAPGETEIIATGVFTANPYLLCGIAALSHYLHSRGHLVTLNVPSASRHLEEMGFYTCLPEGITIKGGGLAGTSSNWKALLPIRHIRDAEEVNAAVQEFVENGRSGSGWVKGISTKVGENCLAEALENAREHSESAEGFFTGAWAYKDDGPLTLAVVDLGIGIPGHLRRKAAYGNYSDEQALRQSTEERVSGLADNHRGFGLHHLSSTAKDAGKHGVVAIRAGTAELRASVGPGKHRRQTSTEPFVPGTWIRIEISN